MSSTTFAEAFAAMEAGVQALGALDWDGMPVRQRLELMDRLETVRRQAGACSLDIASSVDRAGDPAIGALSYKVIADVLRISLAEGRRRLRDAEQLRPRTNLVGEPLPADLPATAKAWHAGMLDLEHLRTIQKFMRDLPEDIHPVDVERAEAFLADKATELRPDQLVRVADRLALRLNPDGKFSDEYRAAQRGFTWCGAQRPDGMSIGRLTATPELRATIDALLAKFAAPGMCNPADESPLTAGEPTSEAADRDRRSYAQRQHDGLAALLRSQLGDPKLGRHNGLPVSIVVSTTLEQMQSGTGIAVTGGGSILPMRDVIRLASHAWHYLCVYDSHTSRPLYLGRAKRIAAVDQRAVLHERDRGCTAPGCDAPGYLTDMHHIEDWAAGGPTDIDNLTLACKAHHRLLGRGWKTRRRADGRTDWIPPPNLPLKRGTNDYHHPERFIGGEFG